MSSAKFLTKELFENAFRNFYSDKNLQIMGYSSKAAVQVGDNFTSTLYRATVTYKRDQCQNNETLSVIIKVQFEDSPMEILTKEMRLFAKEIEMFSKTLPMMYKVLGPDSEGCLSSSCLFTCEHPNSILVLEDLQPSGYTMAARQGGLDLEHCQMVMKKVAKFHAASVVVADKDPSAVRNYNQGIYKDDELIGPFLTKGMESLTESCLKWSGLENYGKQMQNILPNVRVIGEQVGKRKLGGFNVLNHGDLWVNNMMFLYHANNGKLKDLKFVDFQIVYYTSPAIDLHYFLATSPTSEVRQKHTENLLDLYYGHLIATLSSLNYSLATVPSREEFRKDYNSRSLYGLIAASTIGPLVKASKRDDASFENLMKDGGEESFRHHCYTNDKYRESMEQYIPYIASLGAFK